MKVIDNTASLQYDKLGEDYGFIAAATFGFVTATKVLTITEASTFPAGDGLKRVNIVVSDKLGNTKVGTITAAAGNTTIDLDAATSLDLTGPVQVQVTITTNKGLVKDGAYYDLSPNVDGSGSLVFEK